MSPTPDATTPAAAFDAYLAALADPAAGGLLALYAPDAPMFVDGQVVEARNVAPTALAGASRRPALQGVRLDAPTIADDQALAWFEATDAIAGTPLTGVVGFARQPDGRWAIAFATLAPARRTWDWAFARAQAVAEAALAANGGLRTLRGWLDAAYHRRTLKPRPPLQLLPEARFRCHGDTACCDIEPMIVVPAAAQAVIDAIPWDRLGGPRPDTQLPALDGGRLLLKAQGDRCRFLDDERRCRIHKALGRQPLPACGAYPLRFTATPDGVAATLAMTCPSARNGLGPALDDDLEDLYERLLAVPELPTREKHHLAPGVAVPWETFQAAEATLLALLADADTPLVRRLWAGERWLLATLGYEPEALPSADASYRAPARQLVDQLLKLVAEDAIPSLDLRDADAPAMSPALTTTLRNLLFSKHYSFPLDLLTAWRVGMLLAVAAIALEEGTPAPMPKERLLRLHDPFFNSSVFRVLRPDDGAMLKLVDALGDLTFGTAILALVLDPAADPDEEAGAEAAAATQAEAVEEGWRFVASADHDEIQAYLAADAVANLPMLSALADCHALGTDLARLGWIGRRSEGQWRAVAATVREMAVFAPDPAYHAEVAVVIGQLTATTPRIVAAEPAAGALLGLITADQPGATLTELALWIAKDAPAAEPQVRRATEADLPALEAAERARLAEAGEPGAPDVARPLRAGRTYLLERDGQLAGHAVVGLAAPDEGLLGVSAAWVAPGHRGQDAEARLLAGLAHLALAEGGALVLQAEAGGPLAAAAEAAGFLDPGVRLRRASWPAPAP